MKVFIVRDINFGDIDSLWLDEEKAKQREQECLKQYTTPPYRVFLWRIEEWEVK